MKNEIKYTNIWPFNVLNQYNSMVSTMSYNDIMKQIDNLDESEKSIIEKHYKYGAKYKDIAEELDIPYQKVIYEKDKIVSRIMNRIRIEKEEEEKEKYYLKRTLLQTARGIYKYAKAIETTYVNPFELTPYEDKQLLKLRFAMEGKDFNEQHDS